MEYIIEVLPKKGFTDLHGERVLADILQAGIKGVQKAGYSPVYAIDGITKTEADLIGRETLSDKITETFFVAENSITAKGCGCKKQVSGDEKAHAIEVWFKKGVTDTVSESVVKAIKDLGINKEVKVKTGHIYYIYGAVGKHILEKIAVSVLANTLIQDYKINELR
ncbi:MAG: phosphoribosylformylglycinamidine synthase subunit PurS [Endomicrobia bacterium]|nr:phosphoribosylformylglycinamidine synthase subunit PurS [Endomicrobiia bacterium]